MSWKDSSSGLRYTTCWMGDYVTSVVQYRLFPFLSVPDSSDIDPAYLPLLILLIFWHCDIPPPHLFLVFPILTRSAVSNPGGRMEHSKPLHLCGNSETPCPPWSICHHVECQEVSLGLTSGHCSPWHSETEKERNRERQRKRERSRGRMNLTKALKQIRPTQQSQGSMQPGCQHLSLVKCSLSDNVTLITESPDSDFLSFSV